MAPEAILGDGQLDRRVDIYALGCVAYFLLTGERVFDAPTQVKLLMQHVEAAPIPPSQRTEQQISREVDDLVLCVSAEGSGAPAEPTRTICFTGSTISTSNRGITGQRASGGKPTCRSSRSRSR